MFGDEKKNDFDNSTIIMQMKMLQCDEKRSSKIPWAVIGFGLKLYIS